MFALCAAIFAHDAAGLCRLIILGKFLEVPHDAWKLEERSINAVVQAERIAYSSVVVIVQVVDIILAIRGRIMR